VFNHNTVSCWWEYQYTSKLTIQPFTPSSINCLLKCRYCTENLYVQFSNECNRWTAFHHYSVLCPIHTADATQLSSWVESALWTHPSAVVTQFTLSCAVELLRLVTSDDIVTSLLKKLSISIKIHVVKPLGLCSVSRWSTESVGSRRELVANCVHTADADATQFDSCVGGMYWALWTNCVLLWYEVERHWQRYRPTVHWNLKMTFAIWWHEYTVTRLTTMPTESKPTTARRQPWIRSLRRNRQLTIMAVFLYVCDIVRVWFKYI